MNIAVVGLGHIGLPLAAQYASKGHPVFGCDINPAVVKMVNDGRAYDDEPGLEQLVSKAVRDGYLTAQTDTSEAVALADVVVVIVPLVVDENKEIAYDAIDAATQDVARGLKRDTLVIYETTLPVGDTRNRFGPVLQEGSGLELGTDFSLAFSPERVYVGRVFEDLQRYPKIVGGVDDVSTRKAAEFYGTVLDAEIMPVDNAETAEFSKLAETTYRDVNIALANEFARYAERAGIDVLQAIEAANTQPFSHIHTPGVGVGGHCIPVYPYFFANRAEDARLTRLSRKINDDMVQHVVDRLSRELGDLTGRKIAVFGWAYREKVREDAFTVARRLVQALTIAGAEVAVNDPMYSHDDLLAKGLTPYVPGDNAEAIVIQAMHDAYREYDWGSVPGLRVVLDGRNGLDASLLPRNVTYLSIGRGG